MKDGDVKKIGCEWFMFITGIDIECQSLDCDEFSSFNGWININEAFKKIRKKEGQTVLKLEGGGE